MLLMVFVIRIDWSIVNLLSRNTNHKAISDWKTSECQYLCKSRNRCYHLLKILLRCTWNMATRWCRIWTAYQLRSLSAYLALPALSTKHTSLRFPGRTKYSGLSPFITGNTLKESFNTRSRLLHLPESIIKNDRGICRLEHISFQRL